MPCFNTRKWLPFSRKEVTENTSQNQSHGSAVYSGYPDNLDYINFALMNDVILQRLFHYLSSEDVKSCRLVCRKWEFNGELIFKARFRLYFDSSKHYILYSRKKALKSLKVSFQNSQTKIPFTALRMSGRLPWSQGKLTKFFELEGRFITDLTLRNVRLPEVKKWCKYYYQLTFDFGSVIRDVWKLKRLQITYSKYKSNGTMRLKLSWGDLRNIQVISLENCAVQLTPHILKPVSLELSNIGFYNENQLVENVLINEFVNFSDLRKEFMLNSSAVLASKLTLDLQGNFKMEKLTICGEVEIINSEQSTWTVDTVYFLRCILFGEMRKMKVRLFIIVDGDCILSFLPQTLTALCVKNVRFCLGIGDQGLNIDLELMHASFLQTLFQAIQYKLANERPPRKLEFSTRNQILFSKYLNYIFSAFE